MTDHLPPKIIPGERWVPIKGYSDYEVSSEGRIRRLTPPSHKRLASTPHDKRLYPYILRGSSMPSDYRRVRLSRPGGSPRNLLYIHRLVAQHFLPPVGEMELDRVGHHNGERGDNRAANLYWLPNVALINELLDASKPDYDDSTDFAFTYVDPPTDTPE